MWGVGLPRLFEVVGPAGNAGGLALGKRGIKNGLRDVSVHAPHEGWSLLDEFWGMP